MTIAPKTPCFDCPYVSEQPSSLLLKTVLAASMGVPPTRIEVSPEHVQQLLDAADKISEHYQPTVEIRDKVFKASWPGARKIHEVFINDKPLVMGKGPADIIDWHCTIHGETPGLVGYTRGGYACVGVCIKCAVEVHKHLESKNGE